MITQSKPFIEKSDFDYLKDILKTGNLVKGKFVKELESEFCDVLGTKYAYATTNGTSALHLSLLSLNIKTGDEIIIPSYTCTALLNAVNYVKTVPVIVDIDPETLNLTYDIIKKTKISKRTKAIIVTHTFGFPADIDEILKFGISVIEDCAHAIGSRHKGKSVGSIGATSVFSMYPTKMIAAGEGGMVCTSDDKQAEILEDLNDHDKRESYRIRYNYKMSDLTAGLAISQLRKLDFFIQRRKFIAEKYQKAFSSLPVKFQHTLPGMLPNYYRFIIYTSKASEIIKFAQANGVICDKPIYKPLHRYMRLEETSFPGTNFAWNNAVSIPIYPALTDKELMKVIDVVTKAFEKVS